MVVSQIPVYVGRCLAAGGDAAHNEADSCGSVACDEDAGGGRGMRGAGEAHGEEDKVSLDDFLAARGLHEGAPSFGIGLPLHFFHLYPTHTAILRGNEAIGGQ